MDTENKKDLNTVLDAPKPPSAELNSNNNTNFFSKLSQKQKALLIGVICFFLVGMVAIAGLAVYLIQNSKSNSQKSEDTSSSNTTPTPTEIIEPIDSPTSTPLVTSTAVPVSKLGNFSVQFTGKPTKIGKLNIFRVLNENDAQAGRSYPPYDVDPDSVTDYYSVGTIKGGTYDGYNIIYGFATDGLVEKVNSAQFVALNKGNEIILFNSLKTGNTTYDLYDPSWLESGVKINSDLTFPQTLDSTLDLKDPKIKFSSAYISNNTDVNIYNKALVLADGTQTYRAKDTKDTGIYVKTESGFYKRYKYLPSLMKVVDYNEIPQITWSTNKIYTNQYNYSYVGFAVCGVSENIGIVDIPLSKLKQTGKTSTGQAVYEYLNPAEDTFLNKLYNEDYRAAELNKGNTIKEDDTTPFTFEQYRQYHPIFYWKDEFGRLIQFESNEFMLVGGCAKPAVYLYPQAKTQVNVKLNLLGPLTLSIPNYKNGWNVFASPNGNLETNNEFYDYLFWEGRFENFKPSTTIGWSIKTSEVESFLNKKLDELGFNSKEKAQFLEYWLPRLKSENSEYLFINILDENFLDKQAELQISPKPDSYKRYFMVYRGENGFRKVAEPQIKSFERKGFFMFEWGGARV